MSNLLIHSTQQMDNKVPNSTFLPIFLYDNKYPKLDKDLHDNYVIQFLSPED